MVERYRIDLKKDLIEQFKDKPNIEALIEVFEEEIQEIFDFYMELKEDRGVNTAVGKQLDLVGDIVVLDRMEAGKLAGDPIPFDILDDETYRQYLIYKILKNTCDCTYPDIIKAFRMFWDRPLYYKEDPEQPATMIFDTGEMEGYVDTRPLFNIPLIRAAGVTLKLYARTSTTLDTHKLNIFSGLGYAVTESFMPNIERFIDYGTKLYVGSAISTVSEDRVPYVDRNIDYSTKIPVASGLSRITEDSIPIVERNIDYGTKVKMATGFQSHSDSELPNVERNISYQSDVLTKDNIMHSIMETPIFDVVFKENS